MQEQEQVFLRVFDKRLRTLGSLAGTGSADRHTASFDAVDNKAAVAEKKLDALQDLFRTLLNELMKGKVRVSANQM